MAELPHLGLHCQVCKSLDFLPIHCPKCSGVFCKQHFAVDAHQCVEEPTKTPIEKSASILTKCTFCKDSVPDIEMVVCAGCGQRHCLKHRHPDSHECLSLKTAPEVKKPVEVKPVAVEAPKCRGAVNKGLANRVAVMKLKQKAKGMSSIPVSERSYFNVTTPKSDTSAVFLSRQWTVGKSVDWMAEHFKLANNNNNPKAAKLVLKHQDTTLEFPAKIGDLIEANSITDGDTLVLIYLQSNQTASSS